MIKFMVDEMLKDREMTMYALAKKIRDTPQYDKSVGV
ncbi:hypothetical protein ABH897_004565 [Paenibacillus sp. RC73]